MGDRTSVQCVVSTGDLPLTFIWLKDGVKIHQLNAKSDDNSKNRNKNGNSVSITQNNDFTSTLSITSITKTEAGNYTCRVKNDAATVEEKALLEVNGKDILGLGVGACCWWIKLCCWSRFRISLLININASSRFLARRKVDQWKRKCHSFEIKIF